MKSPKSLTAEQIENWRRMLVTQVGSAALLLTDEQVQDHRNRMQVEADKLATCKECNSDEKREKWAILRQECPSCHGTGEAHGSNIEEEDQAAS